MIDLFFVATLSSLIQIALFTHSATEMQLFKLLLLKLFRICLIKIICFNLFELILTANLDHFFSAFCYVRLFILRKNLIFDVTLII